MLNRRQPRNVPPTLLTSVRNGMVGPLNDRCRGHCATAAPGRLESVVGFEQLPSPGDRDAIPRRRRCTVGELRRLAGSPKHYLHIIISPEFCRAVRQSVLNHIAINDGYRSGHSSRLRSRTVSPSVRPLALRASGEHKAHLDRRIRSAYPIDQECFTPELAQTPVRRLLKRGGYARDRS